MNFQSLSDAITGIAGKSTLGLILTGSLMVILAIFYIINKFTSGPSQSEVQQTGTEATIDEQNHANNDINNSMEHFKNEKTPK